MVSENTARSSEQTLFKSGILLALIALFLDQASKWFIRTQVLAEQSSQEILPFFNLVNVWNHGVSFGLFRASEDIAVMMLIAVAVVITAVFFVMLRQAETLWTALACGLVIGGSIGNIIDRIRFGAVYDFLDVLIVNYHWPAFNVADSAIVIGIILIAIDYLLWAPKREAEKKSEQTKE